MTRQHPAQKALDDLTALWRCQQACIARAEALAEQVGAEPFEGPLKSMRKAEKRLRKALGRAVVDALVGGGGVRLVVDSETENVDEIDAENEIEIDAENEIEIDAENGIEVETDDSATLVSAPPKPSAEALQALQAKYDEPPTNTHRSQSRPDVSSHMQTLDKLTETPLQLTQLSHVQTWVTDMDLLLSLPKEHQRLAGTLLVARLRGLQERHGDDIRGIGDLFSQLTRWSATHRPGVIHGLARSHSPNGPTWDAEADATRTQLWDRPGAAPQAHHSSTSQADRLLHQFTSVPASSLNDGSLRSVVAELLRAGVPATNARMVNWLQGRAEALLGDSTFSSTRKAVERLDADDTSDDDTSSGPDASWPYWHLCRGKVAVMLGGDPREDSRKAIERAFAFEQLIWVDPSDASLHALHDRLAAGTVDLLIVNRFCKHKDTDVVLPAVRNDLSRWVRVPHGYGITAIQHHMEKQWGQFARPAEAMAETT